MFYLLLLATISVALAADVEKKVQPELKPAETAVPSRAHANYDLEQMRRRLHGLIDQRGYGQGGYQGRDDHDRHRGPINLGASEFDQGPQILRSPGPLPDHGHPDVERQNRIIADVYSPDYYQPTWVLDYRYLKSGGRDYTRGPGGQILILPKGVRTNEHKEFANYDDLIEHLRLQRLSQRGRYHGDDHDDRRGYQGYGHDDRRGYQGHGHDARRGYQDNDHDSRRGYQDNDRDARRGYQQVNFGYSPRG